MIFNKIITTLIILNNKIGMRGCRRGKSNNKCFKHMAGRREREAVARNFQGRRDKQKFNLIIYSSSSRPSLLSLDYAIIHSVCVSEERPAAFASTKPFNSKVNNLFGNKVKTVSYEQLMGINNSLFMEISILLLVLIFGV